MRHPWHTRRATRTLVVACVLLLLASCGSDDDDDNADTTRPDDETTTSQPATSGATTTTVGAEGPEEWIEVVRDLNDRAQALLESPDPDQLDTVYSDTCECWQTHVDTITFLIDNDQHIEGEPPVVLWVRHEQTQPETGLVDLTVKAQSQPLRRVDASGAVVQELGVEAEPGCVSLAIRPDGPDDSYRIYRELVLPDCPEGS